ncbi:MAG TPA: hypothetical protein VH309_06235, partial [Elusimicrobiota bacterium]|nr:hypothetical protein [Elusimicrobiota bacterium]
AVPALAQVEVAPRAAIASDAGLGAVSAVPAALGGVQGLPVLAAPAALSAVSAAAVPAAPSISASAAPLAASPAAAPALAPAAAAASIPSAAAGDGAPAAAPAAASRLPGSPVEVAQAFGAFLKSFASAHAPLAAVFNGSQIFDGALGRGAVPHAAIDSLAGESARLDVLPRSTGAMPSTGLSLRKRRSAGTKLAADDVPQAIALDADPSDPASVEKALRALVDSNPSKYGAPSSQLQKVSVSILPSIQPGQGASIIAVFRQAVSGSDNDGSPYMLAVSGKSLTFHIKVFNGKPAIMSTSGELAAGVTPDDMTVAFDDDQLQALAAKRALLPPDQAPGSDARAGKTKTSSTGKTAPRKLDLARRKNAPAPSSKTKPKTKTKSAPRTKPHPRTGKTKPRGGSGDQADAASSDDPAPAGPKFLTRQLTDELDGKWRAVNIYQAADPSGQPLIVIVDVKTGEAFALSAQDLHTGDEAGYRKHVISGNVSGRATLPTAEGEDNGPIGPIALPLTNVYDASGKVVAVTDAQGNFSIPDDGSGQPVQLTIRLASPLVPFVRDEDAKQNGPVEVTVTATPGEKLQVMLNPVSDNPELAANIVGYVGYLNHHIWVKGLPGMDAARMDAPLAGGIVVNGHEEQGNAFYDPSNDSVNLMAAAVISVHDSSGKPRKLKVENTAVWSIEDHEDTHRVVQTYSQIQLTDAQKASPAYRFVKWSMDTIMGSDVNESIADVVSYFMRKASTIGGGFYGNPPKGQPDYIRSALDKTPYDPKNPDPHNGVLAQSMWAARQGFIDQLGDAPGTAYANAMIPLILISQPLNPVDALFHMVLWDLREDGSSPFGDLIRRIAHDDHGIDLPATPAPPVPVA